MLDTCCIDEGPGARPLVQGLQSVRSESKGYPGLQGFDLWFGLHGLTVSGLGACDF